MAPAYQSGECCQVAAPTWKVNAPCTGCASAEITRALVTQPKFMMLDEPFAGIDPISITDIRELVRDGKVQVKTMTGGSPQQREIARAPRAMRSATRPTFAATMALDGNGSLVARSLTSSM